MDFLNELFKTADGSTLSLKIKRIEQEINDIEFERDEEKEESIFNSLKIIVENTLELAQEVEQPEFISIQQTELSNLNEEIASISQLLQVSTQKLEQQQQNIQYESKKNAFKDQQSIDSYINFSRAVNYESKVQVEQFEYLKSKFKGESIAQFRKILNINSNEICFNDQSIKSWAVEALELFDETENELSLWSESILAFIENALSVSAGGYQLNITKNSLKIDPFFPEIEFCAMDLIASILVFISDRIQCIFPTQKNSIAKIISKDVWALLQDLVIKYDLEPNLPSKLDNIEEFRSNFAMNCLGFEENMKYIGIFSSKSKLQDYFLNSYKLLTNSKVKSYISVAHSIIFNETNKSIPVGLAPNLPNESPNNIFNSFNSIENLPNISKLSEPFLTFPACEINCKAKELSDLVIEISKELDIRNIEV